MTFTLLFLVAFYAFALWLGLYLLQRDWRKGYLRLAGLGLVCYALALGLQGLTLITPAKAGLPALLHRFLIYQPAILWAGGLLHLLPGESSARRLIPFYYSGQILATELLIVFSLAGALPSWALGLAVGLPIFLYLIILLVELNRYQARSRLTLALVGTVFFGLSVGLYIPVDIVPGQWVVLAIGLDLIILGFGIAVYDADQEGHWLRRSMWYSLQSAFFVCLLIGGQVALAILGLGISQAMVALCLGLLATGIGLVVFGSSLQYTNNARAVESSRQNLHPGMDFAAMPDAEFTRYTRLALSYLNDLPKLASSPLTQLPVIEERLASREAHIDTLSRADELKRLLTGSIRRLKPKSEETFGTTDAWRYYNAVYYPYVAGIKPSRRRQTKEGLSPDEVAALEWFRRDVPERTLYNWQKKAAELVALDLREKLNAQTRDVQG